MAPLPHTLYPYYTPFTTQLLSLLISVVEAAIPNSKMLRVLRIVRVLRLFPRCADPKASVVKRAWTAVVKRAVTSDICLHIPSVLSVSSAAPPGVLYY